jgi:hypothetical protein
LKFLVACGIELMNSVIAGTWLQQTPRIELAELERPADQGSWAVLIHLDVPDKSAILAVADPPCSR